jgi:hypothetical protein
MDKKITIITILVVLFVFLAVGGWFWYLKQAQRTSNQNQRDRNSLQGENETAEHQNSKEKTVANINLDTTTWKEYQSQDLGIVFKIPLDWKFNDKEFSILPTGKSGGWISVGIYGWPDYLNNRIGQELSISRILTDKSLGYIDRYRFVILDNSLKEVTLSIGKGVEYSRMSKRFRDYDESDGSATRSREFMIYCKKNGKTYLFRYDFFDDSYDQNIDVAFGEIVKSVHILQ